MVWAGIIVILGIWLFFKGFVHLNQKRLIQNIPTSKINALALGLVEIKGRARPFSPRPLKSPYAKVDCVFYHFEVRQFIHGPRGGGGWKVISEASSGVPFYVDDGNGRVLVDPKKAKIKLGVRYVSFNPDKKENITLRSTTSRNMKYTESFIIPEEPVYVLGTATATKDYFGEHKKRVARKLTAWWHNPEKRKEFDLNQDGDVDKKEIALMREKAEAEVAQQEEQMGIKIGTDLSGLSSIIITKGEEEKSFVISNESEREIVSKTGAKSFFYIFGGAFLTIIGILFLLAFLGK